MLSLSMLKLEHAISELASGNPSTADMQDRIITINHRKGKIFINRQGELIKFITLRRDDKLISVYHPVNKLEIKLI